VVILSILLFFSLFEFVIKPLKTDSYVIKSLQAQNSKERVSLYKKTLSFSSVGRYQVAEQLADLTLTARSELGKTVSPEDYKAEVDFISEELEKNINESPLNARGYLKLGQIYNAYVSIDPQKLSQAEMVLRRAIELSPKNQQIYWELVQTKLYQGELNEAFSLAEKTLEFEPKRGEAHLIVIQVAKIMGNDELANKKAEEAIRINPSLEPKIKEIIGN
jgi:tetratricopeptide (TPR) repeat protein